MRGSPKMLEHKAELKGVQHQNIIVTKWIVLIRLKFVLDVIEHSETILDKKAMID
jgi:hypothetical protein